MLIKLLMLTLETSKATFDYKAENRNFSPGSRVLVKQHFGSKFINIINRKECIVKKQDHNHTIFYILFRSNDPSSVLSIVFLLW